MDGALPAHDASSPVAGSTPPASAERASGERLVVERSVAGAVADRVDTTIEARTTFEGTLRSQGAVRVWGSARGEIASERVVFVEREAWIKGRLTAAMAVIAGEVEGEIHCSGRVELKPGSRVLGEIHARTVVMHEGALFDGLLRMEQAGARATAEKPSRAPGAQRSNGGQVSTSNAA